MKRISILLLTTLTLAACGGGDKKSKDATELAKLKKDRAELDTKIRALEGTKKDSVKRTPVSVVEVSLGAFDAYIDVQSEITSDANVNATPQASGVVRAVLVQPGQKVGKGQVLATLDADAQGQQIAALDVQVNLARTVYEKQQKLWAQQIGTEIQLLTAKANYENVSKQRAALTVGRNMYRIVSPISGTVDQINIKVGDMASPGQQMGIRVVSFDQLKAKASLGEAFLGKVKIGDPVTLVFGDTGDSLRTRLTYVAQAIDPAGRSLAVEVRLGNNSKLHPNMSCRMKIANYQNSSVITVPVNALQHTAEGDVLFVANGSTAQTVKVTTGKTSNGQIEILTGLKAGDKVITEGYQDLDNGSAIAVK